MNLLVALGKSANHNITCVDIECKACTEQGRKIIKAFLDNLEASSLSYKDIIKTELESLLK